MKSEPTRFKPSDRYADKFVGRTNLLERLTKIIEDVPNRHIIPIIAHGGMGKTALLRRLAKQYFSDPSVIVVQIDYSHTDSQTLPTLVHSLIEQLVEQQALKPKDHKQYKASNLQAEELYDLGKDDEALKIENKAYKTLINSINKTLKKVNKRLLILSDSVEYSASIEYGKQINALASDFSNAVIVLALDQPIFLFSVLLGILMNYMLQKVGQLMELKSLS